MLSKIKFPIQVLCLRFQSFRAHLRASGIISNFAQADPSIIVFPRLPLCYECCSRQHKQKGLYFQCTIPSTFSAQHRSIGVRSDQIHLFSECSVLDASPAKVKLHTSRVQHRAGGSTRQCK
jgi:hypothetical protein